MLKKIVVFFVYPDTSGTLGQKIFETEGKGLLVMNTEQGYLVIQDDTQKIETIAVFKEWLYWQAYDKTES